MDDKRPSFTSLLCTHAFQMARLSTTYRHFYIMISFGLECQLLEKYAEVDYPASVATRFRKHCTAPAWNETVRGCGGDAVHEPHVIASLCQPDTTQTRVGTSFKVRG